MIGTIRLTMEELGQGIGYAPERSACLGNWPNRFGTQIGHEIMVETLESLMGIPKRFAWIFTRPPRTITVNFPDPASLSESVLICCKGGTSFPNPEALVILQ